MVARPGSGQQSMNAGEFSPELAGRIDIKQYYAAGLRFRNIEPVAQAGFRNLPGTRRIQPVGATVAPRFWRLKQSREKSFFVALLPGRLDIFLGFALVAQVGLPGVSATIAAEANLYLEGDTIGIFHKDLRSLRVLRQSDGVWSLDEWPFQRIPEVDLGGTYPKTADQWTLYLRWPQAGDKTDAVVSITVDGETIEAQTLGTAVQDATQAQWNDLAAKLQTQLRDLPSLGPGVGFVADQTFVNSGLKTFTLTFGGAQSGAEYAVTSQIVNTGTVSILPTHTQIGRTDGEALMSGSRGWPGVVAIVQDRLAYAGLKARPSALLLSQTAEYFNVNIKAQRSDGAKLEALRTNSAEEILHVTARQYLLVFTDEAEYFATNRTIARNEPSNFVETGRNGLQRGTWPAEIENRTYFVAQRGGVLFSTAYDDLSTAFTSRQESLLASHLVDGIVMSDLQRGTDDTDAPRLWLLRSDGRLVCATIIRDQEITAFFEYDAGGPVRSIGVDASNRLWLVVERPDGLQYEWLAPGSWLAGALNSVSDAGGVVSGLPFEGRAVWIMTSGGFVDGPFTVSGGSIKTPFPSTALSVGLWIAPLFQSMPRVRVLPGDQVLRRPGRVHTVKANVLGTTSIAIGANGTPVRDVPLLRTSDPTDQPMPPKTQLVTVAGIPGAIEDTTVVISQTRPGSLWVRNLTFEEKL
ncbi:hypothetical protein NS365_01120 [Aureimonas ureilytica]|uniref:Uncharacterized protein n=1 Tax=Aureimonas ureilytica TaxID=401562 RepID=A0A147DBL5_9HYPH|nr:hypothetical protein [Aureimonas ureilytica]KTR08566.1 hypothetical protein NS365_01120 [Aureimonas ureilytica]